MTLDEAVEILNSDRHRAIRDANQRVMRGEVRVPMWSGETAYWRAVAVWIGLDRGAHRRPAEEMRRRRQIRGASRARKQRRGWR